MSRFDFITYFHYSSFEQELQEFINKHTDSDYTAIRAIKETENLLSVHFCRTEQFTPKNMGLAPNTGAYKIYFLKRLVIGNTGLSKEKFPKCYFLMIDHKIGFLCLGSHVENYKDEKLRKNAIERASELFPLLSQL